MMKCEIDEPHWEFDLSFPGCLTIFSCCVHWLTGFPKASLHDALENFSWLSLHMCYCIWLATRVLGSSFWEILRGSVPQLVTGSLSLIKADWTERNGWNIWVGHYERPTKIKGEKVLLPPPTLFLKLLQISLLVIQLKQVWKVWEGLIWIFTDLMELVN